ncbi:unnamed protein product [Victoria cruziana]
MDRNREVRRGQPMANGLSRRRPQRSCGSGMRDSPEEAVTGDMQEMVVVRLRDRKDRLSWNKRRRGERFQGNREEEGEESSEESVDIEEEDDDEDDDSSAANHRRGIPPPSAKIVKPPWKVPDEMIGVPVPRKARSASVKRSHDSSVSGVGVGDQIPALRQCSISPAIPSAASVSPPSSNASIRRRVKPIGTKQRPAKGPKVSIQEEIEIEVAEVLFGLRQYPAPAVNPGLTGNPSSMMVEYREEESSALVGKARASSPISPQQSVSLPPKVLNSTAPASPALGAPKRKRPRPVKPEEAKSGFASGAVPTVSASSVDEAEKMEVSSPRINKNSLNVVTNGVDDARSIKPKNSQEPEKSHLIPEDKPAFSDVAAEEKVVPDVVYSEMSDPLLETTGLVKTEVSPADATKGVSSGLARCDGPKEQKFNIDLMASPAKSMMDGDTNCDSTSEVDAVTAKEEIVLSDGKEKAVAAVPKVEEKVPSNGSELEKRAEVNGAGDQAKQGEGPVLDLHIDVEKSDRECRKQHGQKNSKAARGDIKASEGCHKEKPAPYGSGTAPPMAGPSPLPHMTTIASWPGGLPPIGYISQAPGSWPGAPPVPAVVSMEGNTGAPSFQPHILVPHQRYRRCATHCYIAKMIGIARINPFWAAASTASLFGAKPCNLNAKEGMILAGPLSAAFAANFTPSGRTAAAIQEKGNRNAATCGGHAPKEKVPAQVADGQRQQPRAVQQPTLASSAANIPVLHPSQVQQTQSQALQPAHRNPSTSSGSSSSHKHPQQQHLQGGGGSNSHNYNQQQQFQKQEPPQQVPKRTYQSPANSVHSHHNLNASQTCQNEADHPAECDSASAADSKVSPNFLTQTNHHHHHHLTVNSSYAAASVQQKHVQRPTNQKMGDDSKNASGHIGDAVSQEERTAGGTKAGPTVAPHTLTFSRQPENNNENASISIFGSSSPHGACPAILENQSRSLSLVLTSASGARASCPTNTTNNQQSHLIVRSKSATSNAGVPTVSLQTAVTPASYTDHVAVNMLTSGLSAYPQTLITGTTPQSPPSKSSAIAAVNARAVASVSLPSPQMQPKGPVAGPGSSAVHSRISFDSSGVNEKVTAIPMGGHLTHILPSSSSSSNISNACPARPNTSPPSITKSSGNPVAKTAVTTKGGVLPTPAPAASQPPKISHTSSSRKSSPPLGGRNNLPSILGHPHLVQGSPIKQSQQQPVQSSNLKTQNQSQPQLNKAQYQPAHIFFAKNYLAAQSSQPPQLAAAAAAAAYCPKPSSSVQPSICNLPQRRPSSEQSRNLPSVSSNSAATKALSLGGSNLSATSSASESLKSGSASNAAPRGDIGILHTHQFTTPLSMATNSANNPTAAAAVAAYPCLHAVSAVPMKSADHSSGGTKQKQEKIQ